MPYQPGARARFAPRTLATPLSLHSQHICFLRSMSMLHTRWSMSLASLPCLQSLRLSVFSFLHFLGPFTIGINVASPLPKLQSPRFHYQDSLCLLIPRVYPQISIAFWMSQTFHENPPYLFYARKFFHHQYSHGLH